MNIQLKLQKVQLDTAANYLSLIEVCEENIRLGNDVPNYVLRKQQYADKYAETMAAIVSDAITISKVELFNEL